MKKGFVKVPAITLAAALFLLSGGCAGQKPQDSDMTGAEASSSESSVAIAENAAEAETAESDSLFKEEKIYVSGKELSFPITRTELSKWVDENGFHILDESRYMQEITIDADKSAYMYARFLSGDPEKCTSICIKDSEIDFAGLTDDGYDMEKISASLSSPLSIFNVDAKGTDDWNYVGDYHEAKEHDYIAFSSKETGIIYEITGYNKDSYTFCVFLNENSYLADGNVTGSISNKEGCLISSTSLKGLYRIFPGSGPKRHPLYFEYAGKEYTFEMAQIMDWISGGGSEYPPDGALTWKNDENDKFWVGYDDNETIVQVFDKTPHGIFLPLDETFEGELDHEYAYAETFESDTPETEGEGDNSNVIEVELADPSEYEISDDNSGSDDESSDNAKADTTGSDFSSLPEIISMHDYIGGTVTSDGTNLIIYDASGKAVGIYHDDYEWNVKDVPICDGSDSSTFPPHASEGDGLVFSCGYDEDGNVVFFY